MMANVIDEAVRNAVAVGADPDRLAGVDNFCWCDPVDTEDTHDRIIEVFDADFLAQPRGPDVSPMPIFIVGLPRSGSTLIEQILASHSQVEVV